MTIAVIAENHSNSNVKNAEKNVATIIAIATNADHQTLITNINVCY